MAHTAIIETAESRAGTAPTFQRALIPAVLLLVYAVQCAWFIRTQSLTYDEPVHIAEGLDAWRNGRFQEYNDQPPLARLLCSLPLINPKWQIAVEKLPVGYRIPRISPDPTALAWRARFVNVALGLLLGFLLWLEAAKFFSRVAANFSLALFAFCPSLIANFSLATTDGAAALLIFATALQVLRYRERRDWKAAALCGVVLGLLLLAKFSTVPIFLLAVLWMLLPQWNEISAFPVRRKWAHAGLAIIVAFLVVWAGYFFHVSHLTIRNGTLTASHPNWSAPLVKPTRFPLNLSLPVPAGEFIAGLRDVALHNAHGQRAYFLGQTSLTGGWKSYYPVAILLKWPFIVITTSLVGLFIAFRTKRGNWEIFVLLSFPVLYFVLAVFARFNIGERHVLPLIPFALLFAGALGEKLAHSRAGIAATVVLLGLNAADVLRYAPDYLSYFDILVSSKSSWQLLADSNLDWGQGLLALRKYEIDHPNEQISLAYFGSVDPQVYGVRARRLEENQRAAGIIVVSATELAGEYLADPSGNRWLLKYPTAAVLDHCLFVFHIDH